MMKKESKVSTEDFIAATGTALALIAGEHFQSTMLSSPWTTEKFAQTQEDKDKVQKLLMIASVASLLTGAGISWLLDSKWPLVGTFILTVFYIIVYEKAIDQSL